MNKGKLIGIGVGPGDSELLTIKASNVLKKVPIICAPRSAKDKPSIALNIVQDILDERILEYKTLEPVFPMIENQKSLKKYWQEAANSVVKYLDDGLDVAFVTLGDPSIFSTFSYLQKIINAKGYVVETIPGITSFTACASSAGINLVEKDEILVVIPKVDERLNDILSLGDSFVIMKTSRHNDVLEEYVNNDSREKEVVSVQNCSMENEVISYDFVKNKKYLSTTLLKFKK